MSAERKDEPGIDTTPEPKRPDPSPELNAILDDMKRRARERRGRTEQTPDDKDAA